MTLAYYAYQRCLERHGRNDIDGFTPEQRFFIGFGQAWRCKIRPESERLRTLTDTHSPAFWRVNGPLSNMKGFRQAFSCRDGDRMVRAEDRRADIWEAGPSRCGCYFRSPIGQGGRVTTLFLTRDTS